MWLRWICVAVVSLGLAPQAKAGEPLFRSTSCSVVRFYVARYTASAAEAWARNHGATEADIETARHCLKNQAAQIAKAGRWTAQ
jgi:hypothetical protein